MKNIDYAIKKAANELGIPEDQAKIVVMEYWSTIYKSIFSGKDTTITARHLGTFTVSRYKNNICIRKLIAKIRRVRVTPKLTEQAKTEILETTYNQLRKALKHRNVVATNYAIMFKNIPDESTVKN